MCIKDLFSINSDFLFDLYQNLIFKAKGYNFPFSVKKFQPNDKDFQ